MLVKTTEARGLSPRIVDVIRASPWNGPRDLRFKRDTSPWPEPQRPKSDHASALILTYVR
jgi:hypothetical protein